MSYALDANKYHFKRTFGDVTVLGSWLTVDRKSAPCLVLLPTHRIGDMGVVPAVVPINHAWLWAEETGDPAHAARNSLIYAAALGFNQASPRDLIRITCIVRECIGDLLAMPPKPADQVVVADAFRTDEHGKTHHSEIVENV